MNNRQNQAWVSRDKTVIAPFSRISYFPVAFKSGSGAMLEDMDGNRLIDWLSSAASMNLGYGHPAINAAVAEQMNRYAQVTNGYFYNPAAVELAEALAAITPGEGQKKVSFGLSGSDSIDGAIKLARAYTGRNALISFEGAYHGSTFGAISVSFVSQGMRRNFGPLLPGVFPMPFPNVYRDGDSAGQASLDALRHAFDSWLPPDSVAAVLIESIQGDGGLLVPPKGFFKELAELCKNHGILIIADEIQQGAMRTGKWFGFEHFDIIPDIVVVGKSIGGGLPLSAIIARSEIMDSLAPPAHLFTMSANATCCAAGLAGLRAMGQPGFSGGVQERSARLRQGLEDMARRHPCMGDVRGIGFSIGVEIVSDRAAKTRDIAGAKKICYRCWENGLLLICFAGNVLRIQPPLVITECQIDDGLAILEKAVTDLENGRIPDTAADTVQGW